MFLFVSCICFRERVLVTFVVCSRLRDCAHVHDSAFFQECLFYNLDFRFVKSVLFAECSLSSFEIHFYV